MPIFSYLAIPRDGAREALCRDLSALDFCQIIPADNQEVVVLITDTPDELSENQLRQSIAGLSSLQSLSLAFGHSETIDDEGEAET